MSTYHRAVYDHDPLARKVREVYDRAVADLGPDLGGYSVRDLLADNLPGSLEALTAAALRAGIPITPLED